jgi:two-component system nitrate/nitrite response regulator NarL
MIKVAAVEQHQFFIDSLKIIFENQNDIEYLGAVDEEKKLLKILESSTLDVILLEPQIPDVDSNLLVRKVCKKFPDTKVIIFSAHNQSQSLEKINDKLVNRFISKSSSHQEVLKGIREAHRSDQSDIKDSSSYVNSTEKIVKQKLTKRQLELLELIALGKTTKEIAEILCIGVYTVSTHRRNMSKVLGIKGKGGLLRYALEQKYRY